MSTYRPSCVNLTSSYATGLILSGININSYLNVDASSICESAWGINNTSLSSSGNSSLSSSYDSFYQGYC